MTLIKDKKEFEKFVNLLPDLKNDEVYFVSLSARNKYLTDKEREKYGLGRTEMFARTIVKRKEDWEFSMNKLATNLLYKTTKTGMKIPEKALVVYANINPSSMIKAYSMFRADMNRELEQVTQSAIKGNKTNFDHFIKAERKLLNCVQKSRSYKYFIDIDFDIKDPEILNMFLGTIRDGVLNFFKDLVKFKEMINVIKTHGGFHLLIKRDLMDTINLVLKDLGYNFNDLVNGAHKKAKEENGEVVFNKNAMVPVCGTLQAGTLVKFMS